MPKEGIYVLFAAIDVYVPPERPQQSSDSKQISQPLQTAYFLQNTFCNGRFSKEREPCHHGWATAVVCSGQSWPWVRVLVRQELRPAYPSVPRPRRLSVAFPRSWGLGMELAGCEAPGAAGTPQQPQQRNRAGQGGPLLHVGHCPEQGPRDGLQTAPLASFGAEGTMANVLRHLQHVWGMGLLLGICCLWVSGKELGAEGTCPHAQKLLSHGEPQSCPQPCLPAPLWPQMLYYMLTLTANMTPWATSHSHWGYKGAGVRESPCRSNAGVAGKGGKLPCHAGKVTWGDLCSGDCAASTEQHCQGPHSDAEKRQFSTCNWWFWNVTDILMPWEPTASEGVYSLPNNILSCWRQM